MGEEALRGVLTDKAERLLKTIAKRVLGPCHMTDLDPVSETFGLLQEIIAQGLAHSTGHFQRHREFIIGLCLIRKGSIRYKALR